MTRYVEGEDNVVKISIFGKPGCARCNTTKKKLNHFLGKWELDHDVDLVFHNLDTLEGRAEGAFYDVSDIPLTVIEREGREVARWDGEVPNSDSVRAVIEGQQHVAAH